MRAIDDRTALVRTPIRTCVGCRTRRPAVELVRLTRRAPESGDAGHADDASVVVVDGPSAGRGAWVCCDDAMRCVEAALRSRRLERTWRCALAAEDQDAVRRAVRSSMTTTAETDTAGDTSDGSDAAAVGMTTGKG